MYFGLRQWQLTTPTTLDIPGAGARIDLSRAEQLDTVNGWAIVQQETPIGSDGVSLGEGSALRDVLAGQSLKDAWFATLGTRPDGDTLSEILFDHLESKADPTGVDTARPLELADGNLEIWLGTRQKAIVPFANGTTQERAAFVRMVQRIRSRLNDARTKSQAGQLPADIYRKILVMEARKIGVSPASLRPKNWRSDETPIEPSTTITDSFASIAAFTRVTGVGTWTASSGLYLYRESYYGALDTLRNNTPVSSADNWASLVMPLVNAVPMGNVGPMARFGSSGSACYVFVPNYGGGTGCNSILMRFPPTGTSRVVIGNLLFYTQTTTPNTGMTPTLECRAVGSTITGTGSGNSQSFSVAATDTTHTTGLYGGVAQDDSTGTGYVTQKVGNSWSFTDGLADPPVVTSNSASRTTGVAFSYSITATNTPTSYGASGLPSGLSVNTGTGAITGTPTQSGSFSVSLSATNAGGTGTGTLTLTVRSGKKVVMGRGQGLGGNHIGLRTGLGA